MSAANMAQVQRHPALTHGNEIEIGRILYQSGMPANVIQQGLATGTRHDFDAGVDQLVRVLA